MAHIYWLYKATVIEIFIFWLYFLEITSLTTKLYNKRAQNLEANVLGINQFQEYADLRKRKTIATQSSIMPPINWSSPIELIKCSYKVYSKTSVQNNFNWSPSSEIKQNLQLCSVPHNRKTIVHWLCKKIWRMFAKFIKKKLNLALNNWISNT